MLQITKECSGGKMTIGLVGSLDRNTCGDLEKEIENSLDDVNELVFNFHGLEYISSAGLRVILAVRKKLNNNNAVVIRGASAEVRDVFDMTGFSTIMNVSWL